ncbi:MAG: preprotein translocase subunit YajC [Verrucomicrobiota bacterium]
MSLFDLSDLLFLAAEAPAAPQQSGGIGSLLVPMILMFGLMYFLILRPNNQRRKKMEEQLSAMRVGDSVVSAGGIHGIVTNKNDSKGTVTVKVAEGVKLKFDKSSIATVIPKSDGGSDDDDGADDDGNDDEPEQEEVKLRAS